MNTKHFPTVFLLLGMALLSTLFALQGILLTSIIDAFHLTSSNQGIPSTAAFVGGIAALAVTFAFSHRIPKWFALLASLGLCIIALVGLGLAEEWVLFIAVWCVLGFGMGMMDTLLSACMAQLYTGSNQARMMCFLHTAYGVASALTPILFKALLKDGFPWKSVYLIPAAAAGLMVIAAILLRLSRLDQDHGKELPRSAASWNIVREAKIGQYAASALFHGIFLAGLNTWINRFSETYNSTDALVPPMTFLFIGIMASRIVVPFLHIESKRYVSFAGICSGIATLIGIMFPAWLNPCILVSGFLFGAMLPCLLSLGCKRIPSQTLVGTTALMLSYYLGEAIASPLIGALEAAFGLRAGMLLCCGFMMLSSVSCLLVARVKSEIV